MTSCFFLLNLFYLILCFYLIVPHQVILVVILFSNLFQLPISPFLFYLFETLVSTFHTINSMSFFPILCSLLLQKKDSLLPLLRRYSHFYIISFSQFSFLTLQIGNFFFTFSLLTLKFVVITTILVILLVFL